MNEKEYPKMSEKEQIALCEKIEQEAIEQMTQKWIQRNDAFGRRMAQILLVGLLGILFWQTFFW